VSDPTCVTLFDTPFRYASVWAGSKAVIDPPDKPPNPVPACCDSAAMSILSQDLPDGMWAAADGGRCMYRAPPVTTMSKPIDVGAPGMPDMSNVIWAACFAMSMAPFADMETDPPVIPPPVMLTDMDILAVFSASVLDAACETSWKGLRWPFWVVLVALLAQAPAPNARTTNMATSERRRSIVPPIG
jgi:hypothetical protein